MSCKSAVRAITQHLYSHNIGNYAYIGHNWDKKNMVHQLIWLNKQNHIKGTKTKHAQLWYKNHNSLTTDRLH